MNFFDDLKARLERFMQGRYGLDALSRTLLYAALPALHGYICCFTREAPWNSLRNNVTAGGGGWEASTAVTCGCAGTPSS